MIENNLIVMTTASNDEELKANLVRCVQSIPSILEQDRIDIEVANGIVTLTGEVTYFREKLFERAKMDGKTIEYATVLAFCPPKALSNRVYHRNISAVKSGDLRNQRQIEDSFLQLSQLISVAETNGALDEARTLSRMQLLLIALQHLPPGVEEGETKKAKAIFKAGAHEYRKLMQIFRLSETSNVIVSPREDLDAHAVIDLSKDALPSDLARELIDKTMDAPPLSITSSNKFM